MDKKKRSNIEENNTQNLLQSMMNEDVEVPASLKPEAVEKMLRERQREKRKKYRVKYAGIAAAACLCLAAGITAVRGVGENNPVQSDMSGEGASSSEGGAGSKIVSAGGYDELYEYLQKQQDRDLSMYSRDTAVSSVSDSAGAESTSSYGAVSGQSTASYSDTNVRQEGVGEADIVKTDGKSLYIVNGQSVSIVDITSEEMGKYAGISFEDDAYISEIYVEDGKLVVLYTKTEYDDGESGHDGFYKNYTYTDVYDISNPVKPQKAGTISQSGSYYTMRVRDGYVYVLSTFYAEGAAARSDTGAYIPEADGKLLNASDIYMPQRKMGSQYTVITSFSLDDPSQKTDSKAIFGSSGICYVSTENIYITESYYDGNDSAVTQTAIRKISYKDGKLEGTAQTKIDGTLNDSFCIDEYEGYLRIVATVEPIGQNNGIWLADTLDEDGTGEEVNTTSLYVLNDELEAVGEIRDIAPDENVYSARFMGSTGYFVTFRQVDPLFCVDLSDAADPVIIGQLKIPGFSEYLHPYGDGLLLGIGMAVDEEGVTTEGVKLSMFDVSDPADVKELTNYVIEDAYSTDIAYEYRAAFVDAEKNLFGFTVYSDTPEYCMFTYDQTNGFTEVFSRELGFSGYSVRGLYSGDVFYLVSGNTVEAFRLSDFEKVDDIVL